MSESTTIKLTEDLFSNQHDLAEKLFEDELPVLPKGVIMYEINGALFFGAAQTFQDTISRLQVKPKVLILRMRHVPFIDATGIYTLKEVIKKFEDHHTTIILSGVNLQVLEDLEGADIYSVLGKENLTDSIEKALERATQILE
jgi:SulP family sulfate permease